MVWTFFFLLGVRAEKMVEKFFGLVYCSLSTFCPLGQERRALCFSLLSHPRHVPCRFSGAPRSFQMASASTGSALMVRKATLVT